MGTMSPCKTICVSKHKEPLDYPIQNIMLQIYDNIKMKEILDIMGNSLFTSVHLGNGKTFELANQGEIGGRGC